MENIELILLIVVIVLLIALLLILINPVIVSKIFHRKTTTSHPNSGGKQKSIIDKLFEILPVLPKELEKLRGYEEKANDYDKLEKEFEAIKKQKEQLETNNTTLSDEKTRLVKDLENKNKDVSEKLNEIEEKNKIINELLSKIRKAEHLKEYAGKVSEYLYFVEDILNTANNRCIETRKNNEESAKIMSILLQQTLVKTKTMEKWKQLCEDIQEKNIVVLNNALKNCFQSDNEAEQVKAFKAKCIIELQIYTNATLILCETYRNLSKLTKNNNNVSTLENEFNGIFASIKNKVKDIGIMEIADVKIFTNIDKNKGTEASYGQITFPYSTIENLQKDDIAQIISFGMKTEFDDMTKTKVLIY